MDTNIRIYDVNKLKSFGLVVKNCLEQLSLINNKCNEWKTTYSDISEQSDFYDNVNRYYKNIEKIINNSISDITSTYSYAAMDNNDAYIKLNHLNVKLDMINLELKPLTEITKPECNFNDNNFVNFITPDEVIQNEIKSKRLEYYCFDDNWKELLSKNADEIFDKEYVV